MEGTLIFVSHLLPRIDIMGGSSQAFLCMQSALYSASLTAFLVESYKTLQPGPGNATIDLLRQISQQLGSMSTGSALVFEPPPPFQLPAGSLACNVLWFLSLTLALTCSLLATFVQQWARDFLQKADMRPSPVRRARVLSFLYLGLHRFGMHTFVDVIPMLLHVSLFLFFTGLVAFLIPVNILLVYMMSFVLLSLLVLYFVLTVLPLIYLDSPYKTPLSSSLWRVGNTLPKTLFSFMRPQHSSAGYTSTNGTDMKEAILQTSFQDTTARDWHAVLWTMSSLTEDSEVLPFIEAIPDIVFGPKGFRLVHDRLLLPVLDTLNPHLSISTRVINLIQSSLSLPPHDPVRELRLNACMKTICALAMTADAAPLWGSVHQPGRVFWFDSHVLALLDDSTLDHHYAISTRAAVCYSQMKLVRRCIKSIGCQLEGWHAVTVDSQKQILQAIWETIEALGSEDHLFSPRFQDCLRLKRSLSDVPLPFLDSLVVSSALSDITFCVAELLADPLNMMSGNSQIDILTTLLDASLRAESCPYEFTSICQKITGMVVDDGLDDDSLSPHYDSQSVFALFGQLRSVTVKLSLPEGVHDVDRIVQVLFRLLPFLCPAVAHQYSMSALYMYIVNRRNTRDVNETLKGCDIDLLYSLTLSDIRNTPENVDLCFKALSVLHELTQAPFNLSPIVPAILCESAFSTLTTHESFHEYSSYPSTLAIISCLGLTPMREDLRGIGTRIHRAEDLHKLENCQMHLAHLTDRLRSHVYGRVGDLCELENCQFELAMLRSKISQLNLTAKR